LAINLWVECHIKQQFHHHLSEQMFQKTHCKFGVSITNDKLWRPVMPDPHLKEQFS
jgi:hypothetical protein